MISPSQTAHRDLHQKVTTPLMLMSANAFDQPQSLSANGTSQLFAFTFRIQVGEKQPHAALKRYCHQQRVMFIQSLEKQLLTLFGQQVITIQQTKWLRIGPAKLLNWKLSG
jgi:hypothetical protein